MKNVLIVVLWLSGAFTTGMMLELGQTARDLQEIVSKIILQCVMGFAWGYSIGWLQVIAARRAA